MGATWRFLPAMAGAVVVLSCASGSGPELGIEAVAGTWEAQQAFWQKADDPTVRRTLTDLNGEMTLTITLNGRYTLETLLLGEQEVESGAASFRNGRLRLTPDGGPTTTYAVTLFTNRMNVATLDARFDFDGDGEKEEARHEVEWVRA